ncbi:hypothetical protein ACLOJK_017616 [Asimina triloba]
MVERIQILLLSYLLFSSYIVAETGLPNHILESRATTMPMTRKAHRKDFPKHDVPVLSSSPMLAPSPSYGSMRTSGHTLSSLSHLLKMSAQQNQDLIPSAGHLPPEILSGIAQPPLADNISDCCGPGMMTRRGSQVCQCVYPIQVELCLRNASIISKSNWSREFLEELASQLKLQVSQLEISNFFAVGFSGWNITIDVAPHTGISFSSSDADKMNSSLSKNKVHLDPSLVGDYKLLNFTWFKPPVPSPAPTLGLSPMAAPPSRLPSTLSPKDQGKGRNQHLFLILGIGIGKQGVVEAVPGLGDSAIRHPTSTRFLAYEELREATNNFESASMLGEGGFGRVYKGVLNDGTPVAIKKLTTGGHQGDKEFLVEVEMLSRLHHRNLVKLVGYHCNRDLSHNLLCYELVPNGSLEAWLHGPLGANCTLDWDTRMKIALDAARGLTYLHEDTQPSVIHRDFKASNILLENNFHAKVADFGLAKQAPEGRANCLSTRVMGTFGYVAPEYAMTGHLLVKSDVYSFGVVLLELLTGRKPVDRSQPSDQENLVTWARPILRDKDRLEELADPKLEGRYPTDDFLRVCTIAAACVAPEADQRPIMGEVVQSLKMVQRTTEYQHPSTQSNLKQSSATFESDATSSVFSSGPFSGLSTAFDHDNISKTAVFSEDLHEGR